MSIKIKNTDFSELLSPPTGSVFIGYDTQNNMLKMKKSDGSVLTIQTNDPGIIVSNSSVVIGSITGSTFGQYYLANGSNVQPIGDYVQVAGQGCIAVGRYSYAGGMLTIAYGDYARSTGINTIASGATSFSGGYGFSVINTVISSGVGSFNFSSTSTRISNAKSLGSVILGGVDNTSENNSLYSVIIGGKKNTILDNSSYTSIINSVNCNIAANISGTTIISSVNITATKNNALYTPDIYHNGKLAIGGGGGLSTLWLNLNYSNAFTSGIYIANSLLKADNAISSNRYYNNSLYGTNQLNAKNHFTQYSLGNASGYSTGWISTAFGDNLGNRVIIGQGNGGSAIIGAHNGELTSWSNLIIQPIINSNVGIGTYTPTYKLTVSGTTYTSNLIIESSTLVNNLNADLLDGLHYNEILYRGWLASPGYDANTMSANTVGFSYANNTPHNGTTVNFSSGGYNLQLSSKYTTSTLSIRTRNSDTSTWNAWETVITSGNIIDGNGLSFSDINQTLALGIASAMSTGSLTAPDWNKFNNKQDYITTGTNNRFYRGDKVWATLNSTYLSDNNTLLKKGTPYVDRRLNFSIFSGGFQAQCYVRTNCFNGINNVHGVLISNGGDIGNGVQLLICELDDMGAGLPINDNISFVAVSTENTGGSSSDAAIPLYIGTNGVFQIVTSSEAEGNTSAGRYYFNVSYLSAT